MANPEAKSDTNGSVKLKMRNKHWKSAECNFMLSGNLTSCLRSMVVTVASSKRLRLRGNEPSSCSSSWLGKMQHLLANFEVLFVVPYMVHILFFPPKQVVESVYLQDSLTQVETVTRKHSWRRVQHKLWMGRVIGDSCLVTLL